MYVLPKNALTKQIFHKFSHFLNDRVIHGLNLKIELIYNSIFLSTFFQLG